MNTKYFIYAICITIVSTFLSWSSMIGSSVNRSSGSSWSSGSSYGGSSGGGHK